MLPKKKYRFNPKTLAYELHRTPAKVYFSRGFFLFLLTVVVAVGYYMLYTSYFGLETPKSLALKREHAELMTRLDMMSRQIGDADKRLEQLKMRDNQVYRPIFGMEGIPDEVRNAGFGGVDRYSHLEYSRNSRFLTDVASRFDQVYKKTGLQSESFDHVERMAAQTDQMALSIPAMFPVNMAAGISKGSFRISSGFGWRIDPMYGDRRFHEGVDIAGPVGTPIYATGNGMVIKSGFNFFGLGNYVVIDHGFGYQTWYGHLRTPLVKEGQRVGRGEPIGLLGNTGKSTGPHVHYEVRYRNRPVNPLNYFNDIEAEEYEELIGTAGGSLL
ncbi:MAG: M23 family metallopeptidase [Bacteroidales bacterium]|nr:M23 family metallopeptidase [Bacteroidales bacterium]